jgi:tetratricopeptide (TPR) repeat protein
VLQSSRHEAGAAAAESARASPWESAAAPQLPAVAQLDTLGLATLASQGMWQGLLDGLAAGEQPGRGEEGAQEGAQEEVALVQRAMYRALAHAKLRSYARAAAELDAADGLLARRRRLGRGERRGGGSVAGRGSSSGSCVEEGRKEEEEEQEEEPFALQYLRALLPLRLGRVQEGEDALYLLLEACRQRLAGLGAQQQQQQQQQQQRQRQQRQQRQQHHQHHQHHQHQRQQHQQGQRDLLGLQEAPPPPPPLPLLPPLLRAQQAAWRRRQQLVASALVGQALLRQQPLEALRLLDELLLEQPEDPHVWSAVARVQLLMGDVQAASATFHTVDQLVEAATAEEARGAAAVEGAAEAGGLLVFEDGEDKDAEDGQQQRRRQPGAAAAATQRPPGQRQGQGALRQLVQQNSGCLMLAEHEPAAALACLQAALLREPQDASARGNAALALVALGQLERAVAELEGALGRWPRALLQEQLLRNLSALYQLQAGPAAPRLRQQLCAWASRVMPDDFELSAGAG